MFFDQDSNITQTELPDKTMEAKCLQSMFELIDSGFFNETKVVPCYFLVFLTINKLYKST